ncbi:glycosyltransferase [Streptomyces sp. NPDC005931]|uniref:glycosyltransferase n=1 Tax=Streptomyces sp. NPDC005931 TaxID=3364737 RepID=UPI00368984A3
MPTPILRRPTSRFVSGGPGEIPPWLARPAVDLELIVPALNEERRLPETLACTVDYLSQRPWSSAVVVVDNDSVDCTLEVLDPFADAPVGVHVIGCSEHGKGAAVRRGIATSRARFVGFADADSATPVQTLDAVMALLQEGHSAVIASRRAPGARYRIEQSFPRKCGGWVFRSLARLVLPEIADTQCGFKFFDGRLVRRVIADCRIDGFSFDVEVLARVAREGGDVVEVPVAWSDVPGSTFSIRHDGLRSVADLVRLSVSGR